MPPQRTTGNVLIGAGALALIGFALLATGCSSTHSAAPVEDHSTNHRWQPPTHRISSGETLYAIAWRHDIDYRDLARWNNLTPPYNIVAGDELALGPGATPPPAPNIVRQEAPRTSPYPAPVPPARQPPAQPSPAPRQPDTLPPPPPAHPALPSGAPQWRWPADGPVLDRYSARMGSNRGLNIGGRRGDPVVAAADGVVVYAGSGLKRYGNLLIIKHNDDFLSAYAHCDQMLVSENSRVRAGQRIATLGDSGTTQPMLHFEIRRDGKPIDPLPLLGARKT